MNNEYPECNREGHTTGYEDECPECLQDKIKGLELQASEALAKFERLKLAVKNCQFPVPFEKHMRSCKCSYCDLDRAMLDSPDYRVTVNPVGQKLCTVVSAEGHKCGNLQGHDGPHTVTLRPKGESTVEDGFEVFTTYKNSTIKCPCGSRFTWEGFDKRLDEWRKEHQLHTVKQKPELREPCATPVEGGYCGHFKPCVFHGEKRLDEKEKSE